MTRQHSRRRAKSKKQRPAVPPIGDSKYVRPLDSEDQAGTYAPRNSADDTGESDDGVLIQGPPTLSPSKAAPRKEAYDETQKKKPRTA